MSLLSLFACASTAPELGPPPVDDEEDPRLEETEDPVEEDTAPVFSVAWGPLPAELRASMQGVSFHEGCPVGLDELVLMEPVHWTMEGKTTVGAVVVAAERAEVLAGVFEALFEAGFPIRQLRPVSEFGGSDDASMAADNTSAFNCRAVTGGSSWSEHSYGHAIDINPVENPYVRGGTVLPPEGEAYLVRNGDVPGLIVDGDAVTAAFDAIGWGWGGRWGSFKDYQHFSATGK